MEGKKAILMILDGWGIGQYPAADAIRAANTPAMDKLMLDYPHSTLITYGEDVGLPEGQMGNSEVGHMNIGAGRVVYQELARINKAFRDKSIDHNPAITSLIQYCKQNNKPVHILGLASDGGVHSHMNHILGMVDILDQAGVSGYIHAFTDGRDTDPVSGKSYINQLNNHLIQTGFSLASLIGRYYAMDRDKRWERIFVAYDLLVNGVGDETIDALQYIKNSYQNGITDEFLTGWIAPNKPVIKPDDAVLFINFRTDRPRELTYVLSQENLPEFHMHTLPLYFVTMTKYDETFKHLHIVFEKDELKNTFGEWISGQGKTQLRVAETEKYPHVTFFFSGGREQPFTGEERFLAPSPKVATYDLKPEMSAIEVKTAVINAINGTCPDFVCVNFANTDMVGHTGIFKAAVTAAETVDNCVAEIITAALNKDYRLLIIADHGNSDYMINADGTPNTAHTMNPVPCILVGNDVKNYQLENGKLADIAPTLAAMMGIQLPEEMDGKCLIK